MLARASGGRETAIDFNAGLLVDLAKKSNLTCPVLENAVQIVKRKTVEGAVAVTETHARESRKRWAQREHERKQECQR
jgi:tRNA(Phe) wybutosine-synthesizing methylase Tyw3